VSFLLRRSRRLNAALLVRGLIYASLALAPAQELPVDEEDPDTGEESGFLAGTLFPNNSILKNVILPSYDVDFNLTSTLKAEELKIVTKKKIQGKNLQIEFYNPDRSERGRIDLKTARFNAAKKLLTTDEPVSFVSEEMDVSGTGLVFETEKNRGFLHGPVKAVSRKQIQTSMNATPARRGLAASALLMASVFPLQGQQLTPGMTSEQKSDALSLSKEQLDAIHKDAASARPKVTAEQEAAQKVMAENKDKSEEARLSMNSFFKAAALTSLLAEPEPPSTTGDVPRPPVSEKLGDETTITSESGAFIDNNEGLIVFLKDVKVDNPQFTLSAQNEVKAFMKEKLAMKEGKGAKAKAADLTAPKDGTPAPAKVPAPEGESKPEGEKPAAPPKEVPPEVLEKWRAAKEAKKAGAGPGGSEDISRIIATGTVVIDYKPKEPGKKPVKACAHLAVYDFDKEQILLKGGSPWVVMDGNTYTVGGNDAYILVYLKDGQPQHVVTRDGSLRADVKTEGLTKPKQKEQPKPNAR
jgi:hypothetical protein